MACGVLLKIGTTATGGTTVARRITVEEGGFQPPGVMLPALSFFSLSGFSPG